MLFRINFVALLSLSAALIANAKKVDDAEHDRRLALWNYRNMWSGKGDINESRELRIIGGETAQLGQFPYYVEMWPNNGALCGGALISPDVVLYAAHCVIELEGCSVCGEGFQVTKPDATVDTSSLGGPTDFQCGLLEQYGYDGLLADDCSVLPDLIFEACGCAPTDFVPPTPPTLVEVGSYLPDQPSPGGQIRECKQVIQHPDWDEVELSNDFALCILNEPAIISNEKAVLVLNDLDSVPEDGEMLTVVGLGTTGFTNSSDPDSNILADVLQYLDLPAVSNEKCLPFNFCPPCPAGSEINPEKYDTNVTMINPANGQAYTFTCLDLKVYGLGGTFPASDCPQLQTVVREDCDCIETGFNPNPEDYRFIQPNMLCAGDGSGEKNDCRGDSGGPLVKRIMQEDGRYLDVHLGVVSWGFGEFCNFVGTYNVYARTSSGFPWIQETVCDELGLEADFCATPTPTEAPVARTNAPVSPTLTPTATIVDDPTEAPVDPTEAPVARTDAPVSPTLAPTASIVLDPTSDDSGSKKGKKNKKKGKAAKAGKKAKKNKN